MKTSTLAIVQARTGSSRLPGKMLLDLAGKPVIVRTLERVKLAKSLDRIVLATSTDHHDRPLMDLATSAGVETFAGSETDVLDRVYRAASEFGAEVCVRLTGDCPLIDPAIIDEVVRVFRDEGCDYATNVLRYSWPDGLDVEVFTFAALEAAWKEATLQSDREHVTTFITRHPERFVLKNVHSREGDWSALHLSVDDEGDLEFIRFLYGELSGLGRPFTWQDVAAVLATPEGQSRRRTNISINAGLAKSLRDEADDRAPEVMPKKPVARSLALLERAKRTIPGASQTFSKQYTTFVRGVSPLFLERGQGSHVWDVDGNEYIDLVMGLLPVILGHNHPSTTAAIAEQAAKGFSFSLPTELETEVGEMLCERIPCAEMARFGKNGSDVTSGAVRVARAFTGRDMIACCGYHGWQDWYIGTTTRNAGVPEATQRLTKTFDYNDLGSLAALFKAHPGAIAAVIMEPIGIVEPLPGFLEGVQRLCRENGALLIFDEVVTGFRTARGGAQEYFGVIPDVACFGKGMANGMPISAVVGRRDIMAKFDEIFFSFTFGGEALSLAVSRATMNVLDSENAVDHIWRLGARLRDGYNALSRSHGLSSVTQSIGLPPHSVMTWRNPDGSGDWLELKSLFIQETAKRGLLTFGVHNLCLSHSEADVNAILSTYGEVMPILRWAIAHEKVKDLLEGDMVMPVFRKP
jgi:glutamate-1-semialdehyde aminotransferase/spore coat polysaccharide biosynthesis protein SpsF (cytidylyltransferase family)